MKSFSSEKSLYLALSNGLIENKEESYRDDPLSNLKKIDTNLYGDGYEDDVFKLSRENLPKGVVIKRLKDIFQINSSIKEAKYIEAQPQDKFQAHKASKPTYLSQLKMIPEKHFVYLIEPQVVNEKGYYHVATVVEGRIIKKTVDDYVYYDEVTKKIHSHPFLEDKPWIHIILKVWAKLNKGYSNMQQASPFSFIRAFTYPDWSIFNPGLQSIEAVVKLFSTENKNSYIYCCKTKDSPKVGAYGLVPSCASYLVTGYYQEYGNIFIRVKSFVGDKWNGKYSEKKVDPPSEQLNLGQDEFVIPLQEFINLYHLMYFTNNKFHMNNRIFYQKFIINLDARESKAKLLTLEVLGQKNVQQSVNINLFLPKIKTYDLGNKRKDFEEENAIPYCKILLGKQLEGQAAIESSYADSVRQKIMKNEDGTFLPLSNHKFQFVYGDYAKGYSSQITNHLKLKPGSYVLRLKVEKILPQYRVLLNVTSSSEVKISENKNEETEKQFLGQILSSKARMEEVNPIFPTPNKRQTWIMVNNDFDQIGYGSIVFQVGKNDNRGLTVQLYNDFEKMENYLENCDKALETRVGDLESRMEIIRQELVRTAGVYHLNDKKRQKEAQLLDIEREKIRKNLEVHRERLNVSINPITLVLKQKQSQITRLNQTKQIIEDFDKIMNGKQDEIGKTLPLDDKNFHNSALKIYVFKCLLEDMNNPMYNNAKTFIKRKFIDLKNKIIANFKEGFIKKDIIVINNVLPFCEEYELLDEISDYYNEEAFKETQKMVKVESESIDTEIKNMFFLLKRGFNYAFSSSIGSMDKNSYKISNILAKHQELISRRLITFVFEKIIKQSIENVLQNLQNPGEYLHALQLFSTECKELLKYSEEIVQQQKLVHLMQTYMESTFDVYLDGYLYKELNNLGRVYEESINNIIEQLKAIDVLQEEQLMKKENKKFSFKKMMDYKIQVKKVYNIEYVREKLQALSNVFMDVSLQRLFQTTKHALVRNNKISKINQLDKNRNEILDIFIKEFGELINTIIHSMKDVIPGFEDNAPPLEHEFFQVIPQINILLQRMQFLYSEYKKQARYELSESIKLQQKKQDLILTCQKNLNKIVADALACILASEKAILKEKANYMQSHHEKVSNRLFTMLQKYIKSINRISQIGYKQTLLKTLGLQFVNMLISHYNSINYNKEGLGAIYVDVGGYGKILKMLNLSSVDQRFKVFKSLIDIYVLKNDEKELSNYVKSEREGTLRGEKEDLIRSYIVNKQKVEKNFTEK